MCIFHHLYRLSCPLHEPQNQSQYHSNHHSQQQQLRHQHLRQHLHQPLYLYFYHHKNLQNITRVSNGRREVVLDTLGKSVSAQPCRGQHPSEGGSLKSGVWGASLFRPSPTVAMAWSPCSKYLNELTWPSQRWRKHLLLR